MDKPLYCPACKRRVVIERERGGASWRAAIGTCPRCGLMAVAECMGRVRTVIRPCPDHGFRDMCADTSNSAFCGRCGAKFEARNGRFIRTTREAALWC